MNQRDRVCQRAGCQRSAAVTLSFRYDARQASLTDLTADKHPAQYDLCAFHADLLIVPRGWERLDRRTPHGAEPQFDPFVRSVDAPASSRSSLAGAARTSRPSSAGPSPMVPTSPRPARGPESSPSPARLPSHPTPAAARPTRRVDRYAALMADLPRLAAAHARSDQARRAQMRSAYPGDVGRADHSRIDRSSADAGLYQPVTSTAITEDRVVELEGQLQMAIEPEPDGVVVALTRTRHG